MTKPTTVRLSLGLLLGLSLLTSPALAASAVTEPPALVAKTPTPTPPPREPARYAEREAAAPKLDEFRGGGSAIYIGGSTLAVVLIVLLIIIIL